MILVGNDGDEISYDAGVPALNVRTRRVVPLGAGGWFVGASATGTPASAAYIAGVLGDVEALYIGLEFGAAEAEEDVDIDSVVFGVCEADLAEPYGQLDFTDVIAFVSSFGSGRP